MEQHLKQKHFKDYDSFLKKKEENKTRRVEKVRRKQAKLEKKEFKESDEGKQQREIEVTKKIMVADAKDTINRFTGTGNMMWQHFHQMPNSEFVKCKICHRYVIFFFYRIINLVITNSKKSDNVFILTFSIIFFRVFRRWKNSLGDTTVKLLEHLQTYHKDLDDLFAL